MDTVTLALWAANLSRPLGSLGEWLAVAEAKLDEAEAVGADLLMLPEWMASHWLSFMPADLTRNREVAWMAEQAKQALPALARALAKRRLTLLAGSMPEAVAGGWVNRAYLMLPDGTRAHQDKLCLTPFEKRPEAWLVQPGRIFSTFDWRGLRIAVAICLDIEQPSLVTRLQGLDLDLVLVPSMTELESGYRRVFDCAKARAVELLCPVAAVGVVGSQVLRSVAEPSTSGAAVYLPCEPGLGHNGIHAEIPMMAETEGDGPLLIARDVPVGACRKLRRAGAEAWPGPWSADHIKLEHVRLDAARLAV
ncbi:MAG: nitrilase [Alphaproteobacteria bacterium]|nr:nitrilase [Alphaproteobacteria bacterium]